VCDLGIGKLKQTTRKIDRRCKQNAIGQSVAQQWENNKPDMLLKRVKLLYTTSKNNNTNNKSREASDYPLGFVVAVS